MLRQIRGIAVVAVTLGGFPLSGQAATVRGTLTVADRGNRRATDVDGAVVWLEPAGTRQGARRADTAEIRTRRREFQPHVAVVTVGDAVAFPNDDGFNHNVFSLSEEGPFDLGLYGRNEERATAFPRPGVIRVYCNVHPSMSAFVIVVPAALTARPAADGSFAIANVLPGRYTVRAWHERAAGIVEQELVVTARVADPVTLALDASGYQPQAHLNKYGQPYRASGRRY